MELTKSVLLDKVEFVGPWRTIQERLKTVILEGSVVISTHFSRKIYLIDEYDSVEELPVRLHSYAYGVWTEELFQSSKAKNAKDKAEWEQDQVIED